MQVTSCDPTRAFPFYVLALATSSHGVPDQYDAFPNSWKGGAKKVAREKAQDPEGKVLLEKLRMNELLVWSDESNAGAGSLH